MPSPPTNCCPSSITNCAASPCTKWPANPPATPSNPPRSCTKRGSSWSILPRNPGRTARISLVPRPRRCAASSLLALVAKAGSAALRRRTSRRGPTRNRQPRARRPVARAQRRPRPVRRAGTAAGRTGQAPLLRRLEDRRGRRSPRHLRSHRQTLVGLCPRLVVQRNQRSAGRSLKWSVVTAAGRD